MSKAYSPVFSSFTTWASGCRSPEAPKGYCQLVPSFEKCRQDTDDISYINSFSFHRDLIVFELINCIINVCCERFGQHRTWPTCVHWWKHFRSFHPTTLRCDNLLSSTAMARRIPSTLVSASYQCQDKSIPKENAPPLCLRHSYLQLTWTSVLSHDLQTLLVVLQQIMHHARCTENRQICITFSSGHCVEVLNVASLATQREM